MFKDHIFSQITYLTSIFNNNTKHMNKLPENLASSARCTTIRRVFAYINFGNRRLLEDISKDAHWISKVTRKGHVSAAEKIQNHSTSAFNNSWWNDHKNRFTSHEILILQWGISSGLSLAEFWPRNLQKATDLSPSNHVFNNLIPSYTCTCIAK